MLDALIAASIRHRAVVLFVAVGMAAGEAMIVSGAPLDVLPDFMPPRVVVQIAAPGMGTLDVEELATRPVERALLGTPRVTSVRSTSSPGLSVVTLLFEDDVDIYRARQQVEERLAGVRGSLATGVSEPELAPISAPIGAVIKLCVTMPEGSSDESLRALRSYGDWVVRPRVLGIRGVSQVTVHGGAVARVEVQPDPPRLHAAEVTLGELRAAVAASSAPGGVGFVESETTRRDVALATRLVIEASGDLATVVDAVAGTAVAVRNGAMLRVGDVADVVEASEPRVGAASYDGRPAIYIQINKLPGEDTLRITRDAESALHDLEARLPPGAQIEPPVFRQADFIETSIEAVARAMGLGALLVTLVLIAFLRRPRLAIISLAAIPLSLLTAACVLTLSGASIDGMTLGGLAIAVGEVVDDAIVDVENVWRRLRENARLPEPRPALDVIRDASREVRGSVVYATIIVIVVLLPVLLLGGVAGRIFSPLAQAYMMSIGASLFVALTVTPALCAVLLPRVATADEDHSALAGWVSSRYARLLRRVVDQPRMVLGTAAALAIVAVGVLPFLGGGFLPSFRERTLVAHLNAAPGISLDEAMRLAGAVDHELRPGVAAHFAARAGRAPLDEDTAPVSRVEADLVLSTSEEDGSDHGEMLGEVAERIEHVPGLGVSVEDFLGERIHEVLSGETAPLVVRVAGPDLKVLRRIARHVATLLASIDGVDGVHVEPQIDIAEVRVVPRRDAMARAGVRPADLAEATTMWEQGLVVAQAQGQDGRVVDIALAGRRSDLGAVPDLPISGLAGVTLPLSALADIRDVPAPAWIQHQGGERRITVGASLASGSASRVTAELSRRLHEIETPNGYHLDLAGDAIARAEAGLRLVLVGALVLLAILVLLAVAFSSMRDAVIVLANVPLGLVGGVAAAALSPEGVSVAGFVGFVTLFGIIARNGIMLVAHTRHLEVEAPEMSAVERVLRAAEERLVPIVMTAATAGLGLMPLAFAWWGPAGSELEAPMARIVCAGLLTSTTLNMLVLPTLYVWLARRTRS